MSYREVTLLRDRSLRMLSSARRSLSEGDYDIAAFIADQAVQLYLKSMVLELAGEVPRIHSIRQLLRVLKEMSDRPDIIDDYVKKNRSLPIRLEEAYISSRYMPRDYEREEAEELVNFAEEVIDFVKSLKGQG
ncbi:MAG: HEPN domain-containing protein [Candidatus Bathyarchaeia archaeon]